MCQIQFIMDRKGKNLNKKDKEEFKKLMCFGDVNNNHGFGIFNEKNILKRDGELNLKELENFKVEKGNFVIGHNRRATNIYFVEDKIYKKQSFFSFKEKERLLPLEEEEELLNKQTHPFELDNFVLVHNGMIFNDRKIRKRYKIETEIETDSFVIIYLINKFFKSSRLMNRKDKIISAIKKTLEIVQGRYSCFLYDKVSNKIYYFKDGANFYIIKTKDKMVGTTSLRNLKYLYGGMKLQLVRIENELIYCIENGEMNIVGDFKKEKFAQLKKIFKVIKGGDIE